MLRLGRPKEPVWLDLPHGVRVLVRPITTALWTAARAHAQQEVRALVADEERRKEAGLSSADTADTKDEGVRQGLAQELLVKALARYGIMAWEGVGDLDGNPIEATPDAAAQLMGQEFTIASAFFEQYLAADDRMAAEGNASAPAPGGTGAAGARTATRARKRRSRAPTASPARTEPSAPTSSTHP